jgi:hypothetical protein
VGQQLVAGRRGNLWRVWSQYLADQLAAQRLGDGPQLEADLRHALQEFIPLEPDSLYLSGIR